MLEFQYEFRYEGEKMPVLRCVDGQIEPGKCVVLCGGSGCGKSTLLRCLNHLAPQFYEGELKGFCRIEGRDVSGLSVGEAGTLAASVFQDPRSQFFTMNSSTELAFGMENHGASREEMVKRVEEAFSRFSLERLKDRNVYELSSGERQLVSILSAWAMDTDILLLDEPTANLDLAAVAGLTELLKQLKAEGKTLILSEHRLHYLADVADEYWLMADGQLVKRYSAEEMKALRPEEAAALSIRTLDLEKVELAEDSVRPAMDDLGVVFAAEDICQAADMLRSHSDITGGCIDSIRYEPTHDRTKDFIIGSKRRFHNQKVIGEGECAHECIFRVSDLHFNYHGQQAELLRGVTFEAHSGEVIGLVGSNGSGKTTLGKILTGLFRPSSGEIIYRGKRASPKDLQKQALFVMQEAEFQFFTNSVLNELKYGNRDTPEFQAEAEKLLRRFGMWEYRNRHPFSLSGGQMQKLSLLVAYFSPKRIVVLDEPTAGLDRKSMESCAELIREMRREKLVFVITHDIELIAQVCARCLCLSGGTVGQEMRLTDDAQLKELMGYMKNSFRMGSGSPAQRSEHGPCRLHPIIKLLFWLVTLAAVSTANNTFLFSVYGALIFMVFVDGWYGMAVAGGGLAVLLFGLGRVFSHTVVSFALMLLPRAFAVWLSMNALIGRNEASRTIAALRMLHIPERLIMVVSVMFRFFPVLSQDRKLMGQSVRTRGAFATFGRKLRSLPEYIEILTVPMALRVIRIAETLSASAETRGIALGGKRSSYVSLRYGVWDLFFLFLLAAAVAVGIIAYTA